MLAGQKIIDVLSRFETRETALNSLFSPLRRRVETAHMRSLPDRLFFDRTILPAIVATDPEHLLYVGVRSYTVETVRTLQRVCRDVWTTDIEEQVAPFGAEGQHRTLDITQVKPSSFPVARFDMIVLNGIIGHGVNDPQLIETMAASLVSVMKPGAILISGWNTDKSPDPMKLPGFKKHFAHTSLANIPARTPIAGMTHVYDLLQRVS